jgi:hypothetical protein
LGAAKVGGARRVKAASEGRAQMMETYSDNRLGRKVILRMAATNSTRRRGKALGAADGVSTVTDASRTRQNVDAFKSATI